MSRAKLLLQTTALALVLVFGLGLASAQTLAALLPAETFLALGAQGLAEQEARVQPFIDEFERLGLGEALLALLNSAEGDEAERGELGDLGDLGTRLTDFGVLELVGQEAWIAVSASSFNPLPAVTLLTRLSAEASSRAQAELTEAAQASDVETFAESGVTFYVRTVSGEDMGTQTLAFAQQDDLLMLSTNPDTLRGVLRQRSGSADPNFTTSERYGATLGALGEGNFYGYLDYAQIARSVQPFAANLGFDRLVARLAQAFSTAGTSSGVLSLTGEGYEVRSLSRPDAAGGDAELYALLTRSVPADTGTAALAPAGTLSWNSSSVDLEGWWDYLNGLARSVPEIGADLDTLFMSFLGLDLRQSLFAWTDGQVSTFTTGVGEVAEPGVPSANLLGEMVFLLRTDDEDAASAGLASLIGTLSSQVAAFTDPTGGPGAAQQESAEVAGVTVTRYRLADGLNLSTAVADGHAFIATSDSALEDVLGARAGAERADLSAALAEAPQGATAVGVSDDQATLRATAQQVASQLQLTAGLGGAANLDFEAVERASEKLEAYLLFVADRLGESVSYQEADGETVRGYSRTQVNW